MSTLEAGEATSHDDHGHDHDHPDFLAHHFDTPEQQFDSGKLGIWLFLVTEILFFSGMFCAYTIFRALRPDVFEGCSQFLNTKLGAINTGVLLFSSLTMAMAVRFSQTENHKGLVAMLAATLSCAMVFLGVKAIEYTHKWGMGLLPPQWFFYSEANPHPTVEELSGPVYGFTESQAYFIENSLYYLCFPFLLALIGVVVWLGVSLINGNKFHAQIAMPLTVICLAFFGGVGLGLILESGEESHESGHHAVAHDDGHAGESHDGEHAAVANEGDSHDASEHGESQHAEAVAEVDAMIANDDEEDAILSRLATDQTNSGVQSELDARRKQSEVAGYSVVRNEDDIASAITTVPEDVLTPKRAGVFFGIYYCMTGVHAIHILAGIGVLVWLLVRAVRNDFSREYFGPVDYVGLYWHLVDLIWIYLFPLLYLIR